VKKFLLVSLLALANCSSGAGITLPDPFAASGKITLTGNPIQDFSPILQKLSSYTSQDLQTAIADATANGDATGLLCWNLLLKDLPTFNNLSNAGLLTAMQLGRDVQAEIPGIINACNGVVPGMLAP
jgi:hypothetical protein